MNRILTAAALAIGLSTAPDSETKTSSRRLARADFNEARAPRPGNSTVDVIATDFGRVLQ